MRTIVVPLDLSADPSCARVCAAAGATFRRRRSPRSRLRGERSLSSIATAPLLWSDAEAQRYLADEVELNFGTRPPGKIAISAWGNQSRKSRHAAGVEGRSDCHGHARPQRLQASDARQHAEKIVPPCGLSGAGRARSDARTDQDRDRRDRARKILVPVDFSECAKEGARYASVFATAVGADLLLMHVVHPPDYMAAEGTVVRSELAATVEMPSSRRRTSWTRW